MKKLIFLFLLALLNYLAEAQRPTFIDFVSANKDIKNIGGLYQQTDSTYIGIYTQTAGLSRDSPYYITYNLFSGFE